MWRPGSLRSASVGRSAANRRSRRCTRSLTIPRRLSSGNRRRSRRFSPRPWRRIRETGISTRAIWRSIFGGSKRRGRRNRLRACGRLPPLDLRSASAGPLPRRFSSSVPPLAGGRDSSAHRRGRARRRPTSPSHRSQPSPVTRASPRSLPTARPSHTYRTGRGASTSS